MFICSRAGVDRVDSAVKLIRDDEIATAGPMRTRIRTAGIPAGQGTPGSLKRVLSRYWAATVQHRAITAKADASKRFPGFIQNCLTSSNMRCSTKVILSFTDLSDTSLHAYMLLSTV